MSQAIQGIKVLSFLLAVDDRGAPWATLERCAQRGGAPDRWAVRTTWGGCLNLDAEFEFEPQPSSRTADFLERTRFETPEKAHQAWLAHWANARMQSEYANRRIRLA